MAKQTLGSSKGRLRSLSRQSPTEKEAEDLQDTIEDLRQNHIVVTIAAAALLEYKLEKHLRVLFPKADDKLWEKMNGRDGPFGSFSAKILAAEASHIVKPEIAAALNCVRGIRNAFAHSKKPLTLDHRLVGDSLSGVPLPPAKKSRHYADLFRVKFGHEKGAPQKLSNHTRFALLISVITRQFLTRDLRRYKRRSQKLEKKLTRAYEPDPALSQGVIAQLFGLHHTWRPTAPARHRYSRVIQHMKKRPEGQDGG